MDTFFRDMIDSSIENYINGEMTAEEVIDNCDTYLDLMIESEEGESKNTDVDFDPQVDDLGEMPKEFEDSYKGESHIDGLAEIFDAMLEEADDEMDMDMNADDTMDDVESDVVEEESVNEESTDNDDFMKPTELY